uniref:Reverse transcriptase domain-containing protein n=1 Tax=Gadus morhua TaxID=8049 RepID=A0A8C5ATK9_GADMO
MQKTTGKVTAFIYDGPFRVVINGHSTDTFEVCSGVRQGCPLSVMLFIFAMEPLARAIKEDPSIHGLQVPGSGGQEAKLSVYMDDLTILCTDNKSILKVLYWCDQFSAASSAKLNRSKSEILYLNWPEPKFNHGLVQRDERIKILGLEIGQNMENINWEKKLPKIKGKLLQWEQRNLTFTGKVLVINSEIVASLTYLAATIPAPKYVMTALRRCIFQFVWGAQQERIRREIMYRPLQKGGKNVPDLAKKMEALFLTPILQAVLNENRRSLWPNFAIPYPSTQGSLIKDRESKRTAPCGGHRWEVLFPEILCARPRLSKSASLLNVLFIIFIL